jgi:hypothetical protein
LFGAALFGYFFLLLRKSDSRTYSLNNYEALKALVCENHPNWKYSNKLPTDKYTKADKINPTTVSR